MAKKKTDFALITIPIRSALAEDSTDLDTVLKDKEQGFSDLRKLVDEGFEVKFMDTATLTSSSGSIIYAHYFLTRH